MKILLPSSPQLPREGIKSTWRHCPHYDVITHSCQHLQHNWTHLVKAYDTEFTALYLIIVLNELRSLLEWSSWHCGWFEIQWSHECTVPINYQYVCGTTSLGCSKPKNFSHSRHAFQLIMFQVKMIHKCKQLGRSLCTGHLPLLPLLGMSSLPRLFTASCNQHTRLFTLWKSL